MSINDVKQIEKNVKYTTLLDMKTFFRKLIDNNNNNALDYDSYFSMINKIDNIILLIDHDFINNFELLKKKYFGIYEIKVIIVDFSVYIAIFKNIQSINLIEKDQDTYTVKIVNNKIIPGFKENEYQFYLDNNLITYFKKLQIFITNINKKINDEIIIYFPDNMTFQYIIKYIYVEKNKNDEFIIINDKNKLLQYYYSIEEVIKIYNYKNNLYFLPIEFKDDTFSRIIEYFSYKSIEFKKKDSIFSYFDYDLCQIKNEKNDYFLILIHNKHNYSPAYVKLKVITDKAKVGEIIYEAKFNRKYNIQDCRMVIDVNFPNEKILFFISNIFFMDNFSAKKEILLLGDDIWQLKFYLTKIFKDGLLSITHVTSKYNINLGQSLGFIKTIFKGSDIMEFLNKYSNKIKQLNKQLENEMIKEDIVEYFELFKDSDKKYDIIFIDENFVNIENSLTMPSFIIFKEKIDLLEKMINENGIISFNLIGKSKKYYDQVKNIIKNNFIILKDEKEYCNGYFILAKNQNIIKNAKKNMDKNLFNSEINLNVREFIEKFLSKNKEIAL